MSFGIRIDMILFSIIIPTYNRAAFISKAIDSVLLQTYPNWELIVVDDASSDDTSTVLSSYTDARISLVRNETNKERSASRNKGIQLAKGEYICFLDSDDYLLPNHLLLLAHSIQSHAHAKALFHAGVKQINQTTHTEKIIERPASSHPVEAVLDCHIPVLSAAIHKEILIEFKFDVRLKINEDVHLFARIAAHYPVIYNPEVSSVWIIHSNNTADQEIDYLTPQLVASQMIFKDPSVALQVSARFKSQKYYNLYAQLVYFHAINKRPTLSALYFLKGLWVSPFNKDNITNLLNVLYHLPGGAAFKRVAKLFN